MPPLPQDSVYQIAAIEKGKDWLAPHPLTKCVESAANLWIAACRAEPLFEHFNGILEPPSFLIDLGQIQIELGMTVSQLERFETKLLSIAKSLVGKGRQQPCVGQIDRVVWCCSQRTAHVRESVIVVTIAEVFQALFEIRHTAIGRS